MRREKYQNFKVTIIVLTYNHAKLTLECLRSIQNNTKGTPFELILVDNGSKLSELRLLKNGLKQIDYFPMKIIWNSKNLGYTKANNKAAKQAKGDILVFLNNDVIVTTGWLTPIVNFLEKHPKVAACQPKLRSYYEKEYFDPSGAGGFLDMFGYPFTRGRVFNHVEKDLGQYDKNCEITWATGTALAVKRKAFWQIGGFDEYFFIYNDEVDLCVRLRQKGYKIFCVPKSLIYHYGAYTTNKNLPKKIFLLHHNNLYFILKHYSLWPNFPIIVCRFLFDAASVLYYFRQLRFDLALSVFKAHCQFFLKLPNFIEQGMPSFSGKSLLKDKTIYKGSIVIKHFIFRYQTFTQLTKGKSGGVGESKRYSEVTF